MTGLAICFQLAVMWLSRQADFDIGPRRRNAPAEA